MSILIKGMEMPKDGCHHMICIYADGTVSTGGRVYMAVPVPPHGRLIDADALRLSHCVECTLHPDKCLKDECDWGSIYHIDHATTIIPADKDGEK